MVPTSHLSTISFYFISRSTDVWVSTHLASSILLAISALFFHQKPSAGTHGVFVFVFIRTKCWNLQRYCLCFHIGNQVLEPTALLSLLSYREPSAGTHGLLSLLLFLVPGQLRAAARVTSEMKGFFASDGKIPTVENRSWQNFLNALAELPKMDL